MTSVLAACLFKHKLYKILRLTRWMPVTRTVVMTHVRRIPIVRRLCPFLRRGNLQSKCCPFEPFSPVLSPIEEILSNNGFISSSRALLVVSSILSSPAVSIAPSETLESTTSLRSQTAPPCAPFSGNLPFLVLQESLAKVEDRRSPKPNEDGRLPPASLK
jgi:hypothetical protein